MFGGLVATQGTITQLDEKQGSTTLEIQVGEEFCHEIQLGASVAVDGVCLSVVEQKGGTLKFDAIRETCTVSSLGELRLGDSVHLERSIRFGEEIGGHLLSGHVHVKAKVARFEDFGEFAVLTLQVPAEWGRFLMPKGYIAVSGVSLTLVSVGNPEGQFTVHLIPDTLKRTKFSHLAEGDVLNIEFDQTTMTIVRAVDSAFSRSAERYLQK